MVDWQMRCNSVACTYTHGRWTPHQSIEHRCLEYHYTKLGTSHGRSTYIYRQCTYTHHRWSPSQSSIYALNTATPNLAHLMTDLYIYRQCTYTHHRWSPSQLSIDALNTATPNLAHLMADLYIYIDNAHIPMADGPPINRS